MDNDIKVDGVGAEVKVSDTSETEPIQDSEDKTSSENKTVSWKNHRRALDDMHRFKSKATELETKVGELEEEKVEIEIVNTKGKVVKTLLNRIMRTGHHQLNFYPQNLSSGLYIYKFRTAGFIDVKKMIYIK